MDAFGVLGTVLGDYQSYVSRFLNIRDPDVREKVETEIENGLLWPEPWLALHPAFESGGAVSDLVTAGVLHPDAEDIFRACTDEDTIGREISFHRHQTDAFTIAARRESYVLTTGTGSGNGARAIVVYPMNALANSQHGTEVTDGRAPRDDRTQGKAV